MRTLTLTSSRCRAVKIKQIASEQHIHASCFEFLTVGCALIPLSCMNSCVGTHLSNLNFAALFPWSAGVCTPEHAPRPMFSEFSLSQVNLSCVCPLWQLLFRRAAGFCQHVQWQLICAYVNVWALVLCLVRGRLHLRSPLFTVPLASSQGPMQ